MAHRNLAGLRWGELSEETQLRLLANAEIEADAYDSDGTHEVLALFFFKTDKVAVEGTLRLVLGQNHIMINFDIVVDENSVLEEMEDLSELMEHPRRIRYS